MGTPVNKDEDLVRYALGLSNRGEEFELQLTPRQKAEVLRGVLKELGGHFKYFDYTIGVTQGKSLQEIENPPEELSKVRWSWLANTGISLSRSAFKHQEGGGYAMYGITPQRKIFRIFLTNGGLYLAHEWLTGDDFFKIFEPVAGVYAGDELSLCNDILYGVEASLASAIGRIEHIRKALKSDGAIIKDICARLNPTPITYHRPA